MNYMGIASAAVIVICAISGLHKGLVGKLNKILAIVLSALLVNFMLPYVTDAIRTYTPLYDLIRQQCEKVTGTEAVRNAIASVSGSAADTSEAASGLYTSENLTGILNGLTKIEQTRLIQNLPVPQFMQKLMVSFNNSEGYNKLGVTDFGGYITGFIASLILNVLAFILTLLVVWLIVRLILAALNIAARLPVVGSVNRILGLLLGALQGVIIVWLIYVVISLFSGTAIGLNLLTMIRSSALAYPLYQSDLFLKIVTNSLENIL